jgi:hypothetical protein
VQATKAGFEIPGKDGGPKEIFRGAGAKGAEERDTGSARIRTRERTGDALRLPPSRRWSAKRIAGRKRRARSPDYGTNGGGWKGR